MLKKNPQKDRKKWSTVENNKTSVCCTAEQHRPLIITVNEEGTHRGTHAHKSEAAVRSSNLTTYLFMFNRDLFDSDSVVFHLISHKTSKHGADQGDWWCGV